MEKCSQALGAHQVCRTGTQFKGGGPLFRISSQTEANGGRQQLPLLPGLVPKHPQGLPQGQG